MGTELHWVDGPWLGKVAVASRPRGGEWLRDEITGWRQAGVDVVLSLLVPEEESDLDLRKEASEVKTTGMQFLSLPIPDRQVPGSETELTATLEQLDSLLSSGKNVIVHCRQGIGRTGLVTACLLITRGLSSEAAMKRVRMARGLEIPETPEQRSWVENYAAVMQTVR